ncbi:MAG: low molecular weight protein-tyrosine-phosphatase [Pseudomonadota bacterium]
MATRVLFVCLGNICRSPTAEAVFAHHAEAQGKPVVAESAGTSDWHVGDPPYVPAIRAAKARGYGMGHLRGRQFTAADFAAFDLIIAMDARNLARIEAIRPEGSATPVRLFLEAAGLEAGEVPDPYYTRDFEGALSLIERAALGLLDRMED